MAGKEKDDQSDRSGRHTYPVYGLNPNTERETEVQVTFRGAKTDEYAYPANRVTPAVTLQREVSLFDHRQAGLGFNCDVSN